MSPYENRLNSEDFRRVALIAAIQPKALERLKSILSQQPATLADELAAAGITHLHIYHKDLGKRCVLFVYFEMATLDQEAAAQVLKGSSPWWGEVESCLLAHPRALEADLPWRRAEFINLIADNTERDRAIGQPSGLISGVRPESELWYRTLHQTNWPGVIDQMGRSRYQNWTTFMLEWDDELLLFTHVEYLGDDQAADDALMQADPVTQRWWKHTEPCLYSVIGGDDNWTPMES